MTGVGISDTITDIMLNGPAVADPSRGAVALEGSAPMTPERIHVVPLLARDGTVRAHTLVSEADAERVLRYPWCLNANGYAWRNDRRQVGSKHVYLHRMIVGLVPGDGLYVDHINRDKLDNRRMNLRIVTPAQSRQNTPAIVGPHRGVTFDRSRGQWQATAQLDGRRRWIGRYATEEEAAAASRAWRRAHMPFTVEDIS
jgi:hypothetical protein